MTSKTFPRLLTTFLIALSFSTITLAQVESLEGFNNTSDWEFIRSDGVNIYISADKGLAGKALRPEANRLILDPVMRLTFNGLFASVDLLDYRVTFNYTFTGRGNGPVSVVVNGEPATFEMAYNPYREGGAMIGKGIFLQLLKKGNNVVEVKILVSQFTGEKQFRTHLAELMQAYRVPPIKEWQDEEIWAGK